MEEISVKLYSPNGGSVRRFPFQTPTGANGSVSFQGIYQSLMEKVKQVFPLEDGSRLELAWKDDEGDLIVMNTDDEVKEALRHRQGGIFRIFPRGVDGMEAVQLVTTVQEKEPISVFIGDDMVAVEKPLVEEKMETQQQEQQGQGQEQQQQGETKKVHHGIICDGCDQNGIEEVRFKCVICPDYDLCATCEGKHIHDQHPMIRLTQPGDRSWVPAFMATQGLSRFPFRGGRHGHGRCPFYAGQERQTAGQQEQQPQQPDQQRPQEIPGAHFLREVGQAVAAVLNGFGIDVDVDVEHDGQRSNVAKPKTDKPEEKVEEKKQDAGTNVSTDIPMESVTSPPPTTVTLESGPNTPDGHQDWMILENPDTTVPQEAPAATTTATATASAPTHVAADPRINAAVAYMLSMGFTNEGGWLTQLLEAKNGDISAVLEILHPSDKP